MEIKTSISITGYPPYGCYNYRSVCFTISFPNTERREELYHVSLYRGELVISSKISSDEDIEAANRRFTDDEPSDTRFYVRSPNGGIDLMDHGTEMSQRVHNRYDRPWVIEQNITAYYTKQLGVRLSPIEAGEVLQKEIVLEDEERDQFVMIYKLIFDPRWDNHLPFRKFNEREIQDSDFPE